MTLVRQPAHARPASGLALLALVLSLAAALVTPIAHAEEPKSKAPTTAADRAWLRTGPAKKAAATAPAPASRWRVIVMAALVLGLGGAAVYIQRKRRRVAGVVRSDLKLLTSTRVGPKSQVVMVSVSGRKLLLGVTDTHVSSLGWLDLEIEAVAEAETESEAEAMPFDDEPAVPASAVEPASAAALRITAALRAAKQAEASPPRRFRDALRGALGQPEPSGPEDAAVTLARSTEDVVVTRASRARGAPAPARVAAPAGAPDMVDIEGQARGLILRLQKRG